MSKSQRALVVLSKAPISGYSKTRLSRTLGGRKSARVAQHLLLKTLTTASKANVSSVDLWCAPNVHYPLFRWIANKMKITLYQQKGNNIGERMLWAIKKSLHKKKHVVLIGTDSPDITVEMINKAFHHLENNVDVVIGPVKDGGYVLIAMNCLIKDVFENINWSTSTVLEETLNVIKNKNLKYVCLRRVSDIDCGADLYKLR